MLRDNPIHLVGPLFGICISFWAMTLVEFLDKEFLPAFDVSRESATSGSRVNSEVQPQQKAELGENESGQSRSRDVVLLTLVSGIVFLLDLLCILWWYAKYIYQVQPSTTFGTHFLDFSIWGMCAMATMTWEKPELFLAAAGCVSLLLIIRFCGVYHSGGANDTDKLILCSAGIGLMVALGVVLFVGLAVPYLLKDDAVLLAVMPALLSLIGIVLTFWLRHKITVSANIHECEHHRFVPLEIRWPEHIGESVSSIRGAVWNGVGRFRKVFQIEGKKLKHEILPSRVHAAADVRVQSYILSVASHRADHPTVEIERKTFITEVSHWLDDLVDGRQPKLVLNAIHSSGGFERGTEEPERLFDHMFRREVIKYTDRRVWRALTKGIDTSVGDNTNKKWLYFGLNRVGFGAVMFSPSIRLDIRRRLCEQHNNVLRRLVQQSDGNDDSWREWKASVLDLLQRIDNDPHRTGPILLALTTKTVQELCMSSEQQMLNVPLSVLYSVLYVPLLYFHDIAVEAGCGEMVALDSFDVNYSVFVRWLEEVKALCQDPRSGDARIPERQAQLEMAYRCFRARLPGIIRDVLRDIYLTREKAAKVLRMEGS